MITDTKKLSPCSWIDTFQTVVDDVQCKVNNQSTSLETAYTEIESLFDAVKSNNKNVWWVGNGGSSAMCAHLSQDVMNKLKVKSLFINDPALLTCMANDFGYEEVYARPLSMFVNEGDLLIAISSSGNSENIMKCVQLAHENNLNVITMSGFNDDNRLWNVHSNVSMYLPSTLYGVVEVGHELLLHAVIESIWLNRQ